MVCSHEVVEHALAESGDVVESFMGGGYRTGVVDEMKMERPVQLSC